MQSPPDNIDVVLPFGEALRAFIEQPFISRADLRDFLRDRGIFCSRANKEDTVPLAVCLLLSPKEFDRLKDCQASREDNLKTRTSWLTWKSTATLIDAVPTEIAADTLVTEEYSYWKILGSPAFVPVENDPNHVRMDYEIERKDLSKSWATTTSKFRGSVTLQKTGDGQYVRVFLKYTAEETKILSQRLAKTLTNRFRERGDIPSDAGMCRILFNDFTNDERIAFFESLTGANNATWFDFQDVTDIDVRPDPENKSVPEKISWMARGIKELVVKGVNLHQTFFIKEREYHPYLCVYRMEAKFNFSHRGAAGTCTMIFEFAGDGDDEKCEFEMNVGALTLKSECRDLNKTMVKERLLSEMQLFTLTRYNEIKSRPLTLADSGVPALQTPDESEKVHAE